MNLFLLMLVATFTKANAKPPTISKNSEEWKEYQEAIKSGSYKENYKAIPKKDSEDWDEYLEAIASGSIKEDSKDFTAFPTNTNYRKTDKLDEQMIKNDVGEAIWYNGGKNRKDMRSTNLLQSDSVDEHKTKDNKIISEEILEVNQGNKNVIDGDIMPLLNDVQQNQKRNAVRSRKRLWHSKIIPYQINSDLDNVARTAILDAIKDFHDKTCIKFVEHFGSTPYFVKFIKGQGCYSYIGKVKGNTGADFHNMNIFQEISIGSGCEKKGTVIHEIMHMLGFYHEQNRYDRDKYIKVYWNRIPDKWKEQFKKTTIDIQDTLGEPYDFDGIMQYGKKLLGRVIMESINNPGEELGQKKGFSETDIMQIKKLYDCNSNATVGEWSSWSEMSPCLSTSKKTKQRFCYHKDPQKCVDDKPAGVKTQDGVQTYTTGGKCPVNGTWSSWSSWGSCSASCGVGKQQHKRQCNNPAPSNGGENCQGNPIETKDCVIKPCKCALTEV